MAAPKVKPKAKPTSLALGPKKGALRGTERKRRMDSYLSDATGDSSYSPPAKKKKR